MMSSLKISNFPFYMSNSDILCVKYIKFLTEMKKSKKKIILNFMKTGYKKICLISIKLITVGMPT